MIEHELSAFYNITHGHGLAIIIPKWLTYILSEKTAPKIKRFGVNVFGIDGKNFALMAKKACGAKGKLVGFTTLTPEDVEKIFEMCQQPKSLLKGGSSIASLLFYISKTE